MAEREQAMRHNLADMDRRAEIRHRESLVTSQREVARSSFVHGMAGQILGAVVAISFVAGAAFTAYIGAHPAVSIALVSLGAASIIKAMLSSGAGRKRSPPK